MKFRLEVMDTKFNVLDNMIVSERKAWSLIPAILRRHPNCAVVIRRIEK